MKKNWFDRWKGVFSPLYTTHYHRVYHWPKALPIFWSYQTPPFSAIHIWVDPEWPRVVCLIIRMSGLGFDPGSSRQMAYVLPLYHTDCYLCWILAATIFYNYTSWSRINVLPDGRREFKSPSYLQLRTPLTRWTRRDDHTSIGYWYTTPLHPSIYPIWLYIRGNVWLGIFILATWLYQFSCGSINIFAYQFLGSVILR